MPQWNAQPIHGLPNLQTVRVDMSMRPNGDAVLCWVEGTKDHGLQARVVYMRRDKSIVPLPALPMNRDDSISAAAIEGTYPLVIRAIISQQQIDQGGTSARVSVADLDTGWR